jgi:hypothetical protein
MIIFLKRTNAILPHTFKMLRNDVCSKSYPAQMTKEALKFTDLVLLPTLHQLSVYPNF